MVSCATKRAQARPQTSPCHEMADLSSALDVSFHADIGVLAQCRRRILLDHHAPKNPPSRLQIGRRPSGRHQALRQGAQQNVKAMRLDGVGPGHLRKARPNPCTFRLSQCTNAEGCNALPGTINSPRRKTSYCRVGPPSRSRMLCG
jgi:hypothetical protein